MIVKVELGLYRPNGGRSVLIRNKDSTVKYEGVATPQILKSMGRSNTKYFEALKDDSGRYNLVKVVEKQPW